MEEKSIFDQPGQSYSGQQPLQNATAALVLGILSIVLCGVGVVLGIIALVLANKDLRLYKSNPEFYTIGSYNNLNAGRICGIIGLILNALFVIVYAGIIIFAISLGASSYR